MPLLKHPKPFERASRIPLVVNFAGKKSGDDELKSEGIGQTPLSLIMEEKMRPGKWVGNSSVLSEMQMIMIFANWQKLF